jgi:hypothetical protein
MPDDNFELLSGIATFTESFLERLRFAIALETFQTEPGADVREAVEQEIQHSARILGEGLAKLCGMKFH